MTRRFAMGLGSDGITVNAVAPGFVQIDRKGARVSELEEDRLIARVRGEFGAVSRFEPADATSVAQLRTDALVSGREAGA